MPWSDTALRAWLRGMNLGLGFEECLRALEASTYEYDRDADADADAEMEIELMGDAWLDGSAPEEEDEDNPNWYNLPEPYDE